MTPEQFQALYANRASVVDDALRKGTRAVLLSVEKEAVKNLSGSGEAGSYPIPIRTRRENGRTVTGGNLRASMGVRAESNISGYVFNRARYAHAVHTTGFRAYGNPNAPFYRPRPFLDNAVDAVDLEEVFTRRVMRRIRDGK